MGIIVNRSQIDGLLAAALDAAAQPAKPPCQPRKQPRGATNWHIEHGPTPGDFTVVYPDDQAAAEQPVEQPYFERMLENG